MFLKNQRAPQKTKFEANNFRRGRGGTYPAGRVINTGSILSGVVMGFGRSWSFIFSEDKLRNWTAIWDASEELINSEKQRGQLKPSLVSFSIKSTKISSHGMSNIRKGITRDSTEPGVCQTREYHYFPRVRSEKQTEERDWQV